MAISTYFKGDFSIKKRLHDKKAGVAILLALIVISLAEVIFRAVTMGEAVLATANLGEQLAVIALAVIILILTAKGKDRACYILYGAWISYFVLDQLFELPGTIVTFTFLMGGSIVGDISLILRTLSMVTIIALGVIIWEYMCDKTICNKAFNILSIVTVLMILGSIGLDSSNLIASGYSPAVALTIFNHVYRITMIFLFTFFAYDSAKAQLKKTNLTK